MKLDNSSVPYHVLGNLINVNRTSYKRFDLLTGKHTYSYVYRKVRLNFYCNFKNNCKKITIMLPGAVNRKNTMYNFQRYSWSQNINSSLISFLDPTVSEGNNITIGWFQGDKNNYATPILIEFIKTILKENSIEEKDLTLFGSSAGGFSCLKISNSFPTSRVIVMNPQTRIYNYLLKEYSKLVSYVFPELTPKQAKDLHNERLKVKLNLEVRSSPILYYQNTDDGHHIHNHLHPLLESLHIDDYEVVNGLERSFETDKKMKVIYYSDPKSGHNPLGKEETLNILNK